MKSRKLKTVQTEDGSYTLFYEELNEHYHSKDGAQSESQYVYIKNGLERIDKDIDEISVFEVGFGTGLNAILTYEWAVQNKKKIKYYALEPYPIEKDIIDFLIINTPLLSRNEALFNNMHTLSDGQSFKIEHFFQFHFFEDKIENFNSGKLEDSIDVVFFDAFAPSRQEKIWSSENINKCFSILKNHGILTTYCASGKFKRNIISAGFELIKEKGFGKKREMFLGLKNTTNRD